MGTKFILIPADPSERVSVREFGEANSLAVMQALVGGYIESAPVDRDDVSLIIDEEGKVKGKPLNLRAHEWWMRNVSGVIPGDYIAGDALLVGFNPEDGERTDVPAEIIAEFESEK